MTMETKTTRLRENWDADPLSVDLLAQLNEHLGLRNKSAVMRLALVDYATKTLGPERVQKARDRAR